MYEKIIDKYLKQSYKYQSGGYNRKLPITLSDGRKIELSTNSDEYRKLYESGKLTNKVGDKEYVGTRLENVEITAPKDPNYIPYTRQQFIKERVGNLGNITDPNNMPADMEKQYQAELNDRAAKKVLDRLPQPNGNKASESDNLRWYNSLTDAEKQVVRSSKYANQFLPAERANNIYQSNKAQSKGFLNSLRPDNLALAAKGTPERFRIFPNAKNKIEDNISPLVIFGDMTKEVGTVPKNIKDGNYVEAALGIGMPLLGGALASKAKGLSFVNEVFNPFAGLGNIVKPKKVEDNAKNINKLVGKKNEAQLVEKTLPSTPNTNKLPVYPEKGIVPSSTPYNIINRRFRHTPDILEDLKNTYRAEWEQKYGKVYDEKDLGLYAKMRDIENNPVIQNTNKKIDKDVVKVLQRQKTDLKYTPREELIIDAYTRGYDNVLNKRKKVNHKFYDDVVRPELEQLLLKNKTSKPQTVHRATYNHDATVERNGQIITIPFEDLQEGDIYVPNIFLSTTINKHSSNQFGDIGMEIRLPKNQSYGLFGAVPSNTYSDVEKELLLPEKLKYKVDKVEKSTKLKDLSEMVEGEEYKIGNSTYKKVNGNYYVNGVELRDNYKPVALHNINSNRKDKKFKMSIKNPYIVAPFISSSYLLNNRNQQNKNQ